MGRFLRGLRSSQLFLLVAVLFVVDLLVPDPIPWLDELLLGLIAFALANWKKKTPS